MKHISKGKVVFSFSPHHRPVGHVTPGEIVLLETEDAVGGQVKSEDAALEKLDWSKVDGATGPLYITGAEKGDTLVTEILDIKTADKGVILTIPGNGALKDRKFAASARIVRIDQGYAYYGDIRVRTRPLIGTIGVAPAEGETPSGTSGRHGGNIDCKELTSGTRLYLPVFVDGALFAAGDLHAVQADGELCVSAIEVPGTVMLRFSVIKRKQPPWPLLETADHYSYLVAGDTLDDAAVKATEAAVEALMRGYRLTFEEAYMLGSLLVDIKVNQIVDPQRGVRAQIDRRDIDLAHLLIPTG